MSKSGYPVVLVADTDHLLVSAITGALQSEGFTTIPATTTALALVAITAGVDVVVLDSGMEIADVVRQRLPQAGLVMLVTQVYGGNVSKMMAARAVDCLLRRPLDMARLFAACHTAASRTRLARVGDRLDPRGLEFPEFIGQSAAMQIMVEQIRRLSERGRSDSSVLITGESGTGKELVARALHRTSTRGCSRPDQVNCVTCTGAGTRCKPFVALNCAAMPEHLLESELFGHAKGAFTGAHEQKAGLFEIADGGTVFLDEISALSGLLQPKLLRFLQDHKNRRVGGTVTAHVDVRILAATNVNLEEEVKRGTFRPDLFYRLDVFSIHVPPLRERWGDIERLARHFVERQAQAAQRSAPQFNSEALAALVAYSWPGNVRELEHVIERAEALCEEGVIRLCDLPARLCQKFNHGPVGVPADGIVRPITELQRGYARWVLGMCQQNQAKACRALRVSRPTLRAWLKATKAKAA